MSSIGLDSQGRSLLFAQLAQTERAGLPLNNTLSILEENTSAAMRPQLSHFRGEITSGTEVAQAGLNSGLFFPWEFRLLRAAEISGKLAQSYARLGQRYADRARRMRKLKGGMSLPITIFILVLLLAPLKSLYFGEISITAYVIRTMGTVLLFFGGLYLLSQAWTRLGASGADNRVHRVLLRLPIAGGVIRSQQRRDFLDSLGMLMDAGVPAIEALGIAAESVSHPGLRRQFGLAAVRCKDGMSVTDALEICGVLQNPDTVNLLKTGEFSGRLVDMILHQVRYLDEQLDTQFKAISDWTPRVVYLLGIIILLL